MTTPLQRDVLELVRDLHGESPFEVGQTLDVWTQQVESGHSLPHFIPAVLAELGGRPSGGGLSEKRRGVLQALQQTLNNRRNLPNAWRYPDAAALVGGVRVDIANEVAIGAAAMPVRVEFYATDGPGEAQTADTEHRVRWIWPSAWDDIEVRRNLQRRLGMIVRWVASFAHKPWQTGVWVVYPAALHPHIELHDTIPPPGEANNDESRIASLELAIALGVYACLLGHSTPHTQTEPAFWATGALPLNTEPPTTPHNGPLVAAVDHLLLKSWAVATHLDRHPLGNDAVPFLVPAATPGQAHGSAEPSGDLRDRVQSWRNRGGDAWMKARHVPVQTLADAVAACRMPLPERAPHWVAYREWAHHTSIAVIADAVRIGDLDATKLYVEHPRQDQALRRFVFDDHAQPLLVVEGASGTGKTWWSAFNARELMLRDAPTGIAGNAGNAGDAEPDETLVLYSTVLSTRTREAVLNACTPLGVAEVALVAEHLAGVLRSHPRGRIVWFVDALDRREHSVAEFDALCGLLEHPAMIAHRGRVRVVVGAQHHPVDELLRRIRNNRDQAKTWEALVWNSGDEAPARPDDQRVPRKTLRLGRLSESVLRQRTLPRVAGDEMIQQAAGVDDDALLARAYYAYRAQWRRMPVLHDVDDALRSALDHPATLRVYAGGFAEGDAIDPALLAALAVDPARLDIASVLARAAVGRIAQYVAPALWHEQIPPVLHLLAFLARDIVDEPEAQPRPWRRYTVLMEDAASAHPAIEVLGDERALLTAREKAISSGILRLEWDPVRRGEVPVFELEIWIAFFAAHGWQSTLRGADGVALRELVAAKAKSVTSSLGHNAVSFLAAELLRVDPKQWADLVCTLALQESAPVGEVFGPWVELVSSHERSIATMALANAFSATTLDRAESFLTFCSMADSLSARRPDLQLELLREFAIPVCFRWIAIPYTENLDELRAVHSHKREAFRCLAFVWLRLGHVSSSTGDPERGAHLSRLAVALLDGGATGSRNVERIGARHELPTTDTVAEVPADSPDQATRVGGLPQRARPRGRMVLWYLLFAALQWLGLRRLAGSVQRRAFAGLISSGTAAIAERLHGETLMQNGDYRTAVQVLESAALELEGITGISAASSDAEVLETMRQMDTLMSELSLAHHSLGVALRMADQSTRSVVHHGLALRILHQRSGLPDSLSREALASVQATDRKDLQRLAGCYTNLGSARHDNGDLQEARAAFENATALYEFLTGLSSNADRAQIARAAEVDQDLVRSFGNTYREFAIHRSGAGDAAGSATLAEAALRISSVLLGVEGGDCSENWPELLDAVESNRADAEHLSLAWAVVGRARLNLDQPKRAAAAVAAGIRIEEALLRLRPDSSDSAIAEAARRNRLAVQHLGISHTDLGVFLAHAEDATEAVKAYATAIRLKEAVAAVREGDSDPMVQHACASQPDILASLALSYARCAAAMRTTERFEEAMLKHRAAVRVQGCLAGLSNDSTPEQIRSAIERNAREVETLARYQEGLARTARALGLPDIAELADGFAQRIDSALESRSHRP